LPLLFRARVKRFLTGLAEGVVLLVETFNNTATASLDIGTVFFNVSLAHLPHRSSLVLRECRG
jgi:hypothetical protein